MKSLKIRLWVGLLVLACFACGRTGQPAAAARPGRGTLRILSGSENKVLEPILQQFTEKTGVAVAFTYEGSVDIMLRLEDGASDYDAVWSANSLWVELSGNRHVRESASIMRSPVVFGIKRSVAERLGLKVGEPLSISRVSALTKARQLNFLMTNPTQSNSGAMAYLGFLHALSGHDDALLATDLDRGEVRDGIQSILGAIDRTSSSSAWLKDLYLANTTLYNAMVNYESVLIETNQALDAAHQEPLLVFYPAEGQAISDSPLAYIDHANATKEADFLALQKYLLSPAVQAQLGALGRRAGLVGTDVASPAFRTDWGLDTRRILQPFPLPSADTIRKALGLYQKTFKKPSLTAFVLDYSGSMQGVGERQLQTAMQLLLNEQQAERYLLSTGQKDITLVVPFDAAPRAVLEAKGDSHGDLDRLLTLVMDQHAAGGTDIYAAAGAALRRIGQFPDLENYQVSVILMTDGKSEGSFSRFTAEWEKLKVPVYTIMFAEADPTQLERISRQTHARMFDGRKNLISAFREAKGYN